MKIITTGNLLAAALLLAPLAGAWGQSAESYVDAGFEQTEFQVKPGERFVATLVLQIAPDWHIGWRHPGLIGLPTKVELKLPAGVHLLRQSWSLPQYLDSDDFDSPWVYANEAAVRFELQADRTFGGGTLTAAIKFQVCNDICMLGELKAGMQLRANPGARAATPAAGDTPWTFEQPLSALKDAVSVKEGQGQLQVRFNRSDRPPAAVQVFCATDVLTGYTVSPRAEGIDVILAKGPRYTAGADILVVLRPASATALGVQLR